MGQREVRHIQPATSTKFMGTLHIHLSYPAIETVNFTPPPDLEARVDKSIMSGKINKALGANGIHVEMLKVDPQTWANILAELSSTLGRLAKFPSQWEEGYLFPVFKRGREKTHITTDLYSCYPTREKI